MNPPFACPYTVRRSPRARHVRLVVTAEGLEVVVPQRFCVARDLESLLESKKDWIAKAMEKVAVRTRLREATQSLPETVDLRALGERWRVAVAPLQKDRLLASEGTIVLTSEFSEDEAILALRRWLLGRGRVHLPPLLRDAAKTHGFRVADVVVREQKSLWGSCSSKGNINLNSRLLFLPSHLVRHVLLHELCHLEEMNHSRAFHVLLARLDPEAERQARELKQAWSLVPGWAL